ncbi:protein HEXIM1 [Pholidichthys leucotaenia]
MTEPSRKRHHLETSGCPSGANSGEMSEHPPASNNHGGGPANGDRGRQRAQQQRRQQICRDFNTEKSEQTKGGQREVCPALAAGNDLQKFPQQSHQKQSEGGFNFDGRESLLIESDVGLEPRQGKKRHRRRPNKKKRHWKPYNKLSWEEKKERDERESVRASKMREEMFAKGLPVAPYNTTQFLMDEHDREEPDLNTEIGVRRSLGEDTVSEEDFFDHDEEDDDDGGSDGIGRPGNAGGEYLHRDFCETYEMYHVESLQNMTKQQLVQEYLELEKCMSRLEEENNRLRRQTTEGRGQTVDSSTTRLREMERELERLRAQNTELLQQSQPSKVEGQSM